MLSIDLIRRDPDLVRKSLADRGEEDPIPQVLELDAQRRQVITEGDQLRSQRNDVSRKIGQSRSSGQEPPSDVVAEMRVIGQRISQLEEQTRALEETIHNILLGLPNIVRDDVPRGTDESSNLVTRHWGEPKRFEFTPQPHWDLGEQLGIIDFSGE